MATVACWNLHCQLIWIRCEAQWIKLQWVCHPRPACVCGRRHLIHSESLHVMGRFLWCVLNVCVWVCVCVMIMKSRNKSHQGILLAQHDSCRSSNLWKIKSDASWCITLWCVTKAWCIGFMFLNLPDYSVTDTYGSYAYIYIFIYLNHVSLWLW